MKKSAAVRISYVDGLRLQYAVLAGCQEIILHERELNSINVFPIPDKDTGTNLKKTLLPILDTFPLSQTDIHIIIRKISELVSQSALGYSGIIFSQIFLGLSDGLKNLNTLRTKDLGPISQWMVKRAYQSVEHPAEGTILSVLKEWAKGISRLCTSTHDFVRLLQESYPPALSALQKTPLQLEALKKSRVVDAGGKAFVYFLEGIIRYTDRGQIRQFPLKEEKATLKYLIRGGRITKAKGLVAKILHVNPILSISSQGKLFSVAKAWGRKHLEKKIIDLATEGGKEQTVRLAAAVAHTNAFQIGQRIKYKLQERTGQNIEMMMNASPVLGAHAGPGAFGVAVLKRALQSSPESGLQKT